MSAENFLKSLKSGFPETVKSAESNNVYHLIAAKNDTRVGVSAVLEPGYPAKHKHLKVMSIALVLRVVVVGDENPFEGFKTRAVAQFVMADGTVIEGRRTDKLYLPITYWPVGPAELVQSMTDQNVYQRIAEWLKARIVADGGTMLFEDDVVAQTLASKFGEIPNEPLHLFTLPGDETEATQQDTDAVEGFKDALPPAPTSPDAPPPSPEALHQAAKKLAGSSDAPKTPDELIKGGLEGVPPALKQQFADKLGFKLDATGEPIPVEADPEQVKAYFAYIEELDGKFDPVTFADWLGEQ